MIDQETSKQEFRKILLIEAAALVLGLIFNYFFYSKGLGISVPIFVIVMLLSGFYLASFLKIKIKKTALLLVVPLLIFSIMLAVHNGKILTIINLITCFYLLMMLVYFVTKPDLQNYSYLDYLIITSCVPFFILGSSSISITKYRKQIQQFKKPQAFSQILRGSLFALPILLMFIFLFSSADQVFAKYFWQLFDGISLPSFDLLLLIRIIVFTLVLTGIFKYSLRISKRASFNFAETYGAGISTKSSHLESIELSIILGSINALFATFIFLQFKYLFGGTDNIINQGFTYASYAREGFFQLIAAVLISFIVVRSIEKNLLEKLKAGNLFKCLSIVLIIQIIIVTISAFKRLEIYEDAYGYTELRFYSHIFTVFLAAVFFILAVKILFNKKEHYFLFAIFVSSLITLMILNSLNPQAFIARKNVDRFIASGKIDMHYLSTLSSDAIPEIVKAAELSPQSDPDFLNVARCLEKKSLLMKTSNWQSITLSGYRANESLKGHLKEGCYYQGRGY